MCMDRFGNTINLNNIIAGIYFGTCKDMFPKGLKISIFAIIKKAKNQNENFGGI